MRIASLQLSVVENDKRATIEKALKSLYRARGAELMILPELWNIGFMNFERYVTEAEDRNGPTLAALKEAARELQTHIHAGSFVEKEEDRYYNSSFLLSPQGEILACYRKIHLFGYNSREAQILSRGRRVVVADTAIGRLGLATCYDLRFPELFRRMAASGADLFLICSAWPLARLDPWILLNRVRALENQCYLVSANAAGQNGGTRYAGHSMIVDPWGAVLAGSGEEETLLEAEIDLSAVRSARADFPALADRQPWLEDPGAGDPAAA